MVGHDTTAKMTTPTEAKVYDKDGDLTLCVRPTETLYQVCPDSLACASPVFKKMLLGGFAEFRPAAGDWAVDLPEDDSEAMEIFLGMVHSRFEMVPKILPVAKLYALLTLTNKYDATAVVQPWAQSWLDAVKGETHDYRLLGIAWEMGDDKLFREMVSSMIWNSIVGADGWLRFGSRQHLRGVDNPFQPSDDFGIDPYSLEHFLYLRPTGTIEMIEAGRKSMIEAALEPFAKLQSSLDLKARRDYDARLRCNCTNQGSSLCKNVANAGFYSEAISREGAFQRSFSYLDLILDSWKIRLVEPGGCEEFVADRLISGARQAGSVWANMVLIREDQMIALKRQAQKTGISPTSRRRLFYSEPAHPGEMAMDWPN